MKAAVAYPCDGCLLSAGAFPSRHTFILFFLSLTFSNNPCRLALFSAQ